MMRGVRLMGARATGAYVPPVNPLTLDAILSGHSLVNTEMPVMLQRFVEARALAEGVTAGTVDYSVINGSSMQGRWDNGPTAQGVDARAVLPAGDTGLFVIAEAGPIESYTTGASPTIAQDYGLRWFDLATTSRPGARVWLYMTWAELTSGPGATIPGDSLAFVPWRSRPMTDLARWESIATYVNAEKADPTAPDMLISPVGLAFGRLYDDVVAGTFPGVAAGDFFTAFWEDEIHANDLGRYYVALVHYACVYRRSPVGLPHALIDAFATPFSPAPTALQAARMQALVWDVVRSYARSGVATALAPTLTYLALDATPAADTALELEYWYATGYPTPTLGLSWRLDGAEVSTASSFTPTAADIGKTFTLRVTATNASGSSVLDTAPVVIAAAGVPVAVFDGTAYPTAIPTVNSPSQTIVLRFRPTSTALQRILGGSFLLNSFGDLHFYWEFYTASFAAVLVGENTSPGGGAGQIASMPFSSGQWHTLMIATRNDASLPGGRTVSIWANGVAIHGSTTAAAGNFYRQEEVVARGDGSNPFIGELELVWLSDDAGLDPATHYASFFDGAGAVQLTGAGVVGGVTPSLYLTGDAALWNSGLDVNGAAFTPNGTVTQGSA